MYTNDTCGGCGVHLKLAQAKSTVLDTEGFGIFLPIAVHCDICTLGVQHAMNQIYSGVELHFGSAHVWCQLCGNIFGQSASPGVEECKCTRCGWEFDVTVLAPVTRRGHLSVVR